MPLIDMKKIETRAADLVVAELGALRWELRDTGILGKRIRDYDLIFDDHCEPLEVTTTADKAVVNTMDRMEGNNWIAGDVRRVWGVMVPYTYVGPDGTKRPFDRMACVELLVPFVEQLERGGVERFETDTYAYAQGHPYRQWAHALFLLGIRHGSSYMPSSPDDRPGIWLWTGGGGSYGTDTVAEVVEAVAAHDDNQEKLAACPEAPRRHLFVMFTMAAEGMALPALLSVLDDKDFPLPKIPTLPDAITTVWAGTMDRGLYVTPPGNWQRFGGSTGLG